MRALAPVVVEALLIAALGSVLALAANAVSPRGLRLDRDYFPGAKNPPVVSAAGAGFPTTPTMIVGARAGPADGVLRRLAQRQLRAATHDEVIGWFQDPRYEQGLFVFIDARDDSHYQAGHIPGAWQFNHYRMENFLPVVLPVCLTAFKVIVYCTGGQCEDSEFAAVMLRDAGVPPENLCVYPGGITEWMANHQAVELGARRSGQLVPAKP